MLLRKQSNSALILEISLRTLHIGTSANSFNSSANTGKHKLAANGYSSYFPFHFKASKTAYLRSVMLPCAYDLGALPRDL